MPLHPLIQSLLDQMAAAGLPRTSELPVAEARRMAAERPRAFARLGQPPIEVDAVEDRTIDGPAGAIPVRIYRSGPAGGRPLIVYFHGGGWVICSLDTHDIQARALAREAGAVVVSVDYRMAPEHPFPAAPDDCLAALRWAVDSAEALGADPTRAFVAGDSAGGNLAAVAALDAAGGGPALAGQILFYPVTDHPAAGHASYRTFAEGYGLTDRDMAWFAGQYLQDPAAAAHPRFAPARASLPRSLAPALVLTAEYDVLRDEAEAYARRLAEAGLPVTHRRFEGVNHGYLGLIGLLPAADESIAEAARFVARIGSGLTSRAEEVAAS